MVLGASCSIATTTGDSSGLSICDQLHSLEGGGSAHSWDDALTWLRQACLGTANDAPARNVIGPCIIDRQQQHQQQQHGLCADGALEGHESCSAAFWPQTQAHTHMPPQGGAQCVIRCSAGGQTANGASLALAATCAPYSLQSTQSSVDGEGCDLGRGSRVSGVSGRDVSGSGSEPGPCENGAGAAAGVNSGGGTSLLDLGFSWGDMGVPNVEPEDPWLAAILLESTPHPPTLAPLPPQPVSQPVPDKGAAQLLAPQQPHASPHTTSQQPMQPPSWAANAAQDHPLWNTITTGMGKPPPVHSTPSSCTTSAGTASTGNASNRSLVGQPGRPAAAGVPWFAATLPSAPARGELVAPFATALPAGTVTAAGEVVGRLRASKTSGGRRKCTTERNRDKAALAEEQAAQLCAQVSALVADHTALVLRAKALEGLLAVRDDVSILLEQFHSIKAQPRAHHPQHTTAARDGWDAVQGVPPNHSHSRIALPPSHPHHANPHHASPAVLGVGHSGRQGLGRHPPDAELLAAAAARPSVLAASVKMFVDQLGEALMAYESAPKDPLSSAIEAASIAARSSPTPPPTVPHTHHSWPLHHGYRQQTALLAAIRDAGLTPDTAPPRLAALVRLSSLILDSMCLVMRAHAAVKPQTIAHLAPLDLETLQPARTQPDCSFWVRVAGQLRLTGEQVGLICAAVAVVDGKLREGVRERDEALAAMQAACSAPHDAGAFIAPISQGGANMAAALRRVEGVLVQELRATCTLCGYLFSQVLYPDQIAALQVHSWPYVGQGAEVMRAVAGGLCTPDTTPAPPPMLSTTPPVATWVSG